MSFQTFWENITEEFTESIRQDLDNHVQKITDKPTYIGDIKILGLNFGSVAPEIELVDLIDPYPEFYQFEDLDHSYSHINGHNTSSLHMPPFSCPGHCLHPDHAEENSSVTNVDHYDNSASYANYHSHQHLANSTPFSFNHLGTSSHILSPQSLHPSRQAWEAALDVDSDQEMEEGLEDFQLGHSNDVGASSQFLRRSQDYFGSFPPSPPSYYNPANQALHSKHDEDIQAYLKIKYFGDFSLTLNTSLSIDYPTKNFASLPLQLKVTGFDLEAQAVVAYLQSKVRFSLLPDVVSDKQILGALRIESTIGDATRHTLKNVDRLESFVLELVRQMVTKKLVFPNFITHHLQPTS